MFQPKIKTKNIPEIKVASKLINDGYIVLKNGWPDFLAIKDGKLRFIEVKPRKNRTLSRRQKLMAEALAKIGVEVELMYGDE